MFYLVNEETNEWWSINQYPAIEDADFYECVHALGWTKIKSINKGIEASSTVFVPMKGTMEIWTHSIKNTTEKEQTFSLYSVYSLKNECGFSKCTFNSQDQTIYNVSFPMAGRYEDQPKLKDQNNFV